MDVGSFFDGLMHYLEAVSTDPVVYSIVFFVYVLLATIVLPIPVEVGLFFSLDAIPFWAKALIMGLGKMTGAFLVFFIGLKVGDTVRGWSATWGWFNWIVMKCEWLVAKLGYFGLFLILSIPIMTDTVPLYIFSVFNERGVLEPKWFSLVCFFSGVTRAMVVYAFFYILGWKLV